MHGFEKFSLHVPRGQDDHDFRFHVYVVRFHIYYDVHKCVWWRTEDQRGFPSLPMSSELGSGRELGNNSF